MDVGTFTGFELLLGRATGVQVLIRTNGYLERIVPQGNGAASSLAGLSNTREQARGKVFNFLERSKAGVFFLFPHCFVCSLRAFLVSLWELHCSVLG